jgi:hypothetical protein
MMNLSSQLHPESLGLLPIAVRPEQFEVLWHGHRPLRPEEGLLLAVLRQAFDDLRRLRHAVRRRDQRLFIDAYDWVMSDDRSHPFSFVNMCEALKLEPDALRAHVAEDPWPAAA